MTGPTFGAGARFAAGLVHALSQTATIERNMGGSGDWGGAENWQPLHSNVRCTIKTLISTESRERRTTSFTLAADAVEVVTENWLSDVQSTDRLMIGGLAYDILSVNRVGHADFTKVYAQRRTT